MLLCVAFQKFPSLLLYKTFKCKSRTRACKLIAHFIFLYIFKLLYHREVSVSFYFDDIIRYVACPSCYPACIFFSISMYIRRRWHFLSF